MVEEVWWSAVYEGSVDVVDGCDLSACYVSGSSGGGYFAVSGDSEDSVEAAADCLYYVYCVSVAAVSDSE